MPKGDPVHDRTIYDLASLTKILSTSMTAMHLLEKGDIRLDDPLKKHIFNIDTTNKADITLGRLLAHHGQLRPWVPFYTSTLPVNKNQKLNPEYYRETLQAGFSNPVAKNMFLRDDYTDSVYAEIYKTPLRSSDSYRYSDLGYYLLHKAFHNKIDVPIEEFVSQQFYTPLGLRYTGFNPVYRHDINLIAPSEMDDSFRHQMIRGYVQDKGAAMLGGVAGHSGLFSTATEVTILMQMLLNGGAYGGIRFFSPETVAYFTSRYPESTRRGYGFDMKELDENKKPNMSSMASPSTFGHLGYTGTATWADPDNQLIYTFCSNRTYPSASNSALTNLRIREKVQTVVYQAMFSYRQPKIP
jgi:CubicO group peptidase (beta-lactamase class C family)